MTHLRVLTYPYSQSIQCHHSTTIYSSPSKIIKIEVSNTVVNFHFQASHFEHFSFLNYELLVKFFFKRLSAMESNDWFLDQPKC